MSNNPSIETICRANPLAFRNIRPAKDSPAGKMLRRILRLAGRAVADYHLIEEGDRILVGLSGGKDSWTMLETLLSLKSHAPIRFDVAAVHIHPGFADPDYNEALGRMWKYCAQLGVEAHLVHGDFGTRAASMAVGGTRCFLCARFRRGILYRTAPRLECSKIALGHHADDLIETLIMNLAFSGQLKSMPPKLRADDGTNTVIRPLCLVPEAKIRDYAQTRGLPIVAAPCALCGGQADSRRQWIKKLLSEFEDERPDIKGYMLAALTHVRASHLADPHLYDFE
ncbi:MAG: tRNA 2-thiocytidine(32) synthetase TtcA [Deltaproteobacteria bacterium]|nr:tRNA 2-thiocytidine(32) synthetase TtcA [Deltaproteobacteria bacterium]